MILATYSVSRQITLICYYVGMGKTPRKTGEKAMTQRVGVVDDLLAFEEFRATILPAIREDIKAGLSADEIRKKYEAVAVAKMVSLLVTSDNEAAVVAAAKDLQDRTSGKAKERKEIEHRLGKLSDQELDAMLLSESQTSEETD